MMQFETPFESGGVAQQKTSGLAIASLVCSLICCLPVTTIPGILLGIAAMASISANPMRRGRGLAIAGILLGVIFTAGQAYVYPKGARWVAEAYDLAANGPQEAIAAGFRGDPAGFRSRFYGSGAQAGDQEAQDFIDQLRARYGEFVSCRLDEQSRSPGPGDWRMAFPYVLQFDNAEVLAEVEVVLGDPATGDWDIMRLGFIKVTDKERGDLTYPPKPAAAQPAAPDNGDGG